MEVRQNGPPQVSKVLGGPSIPGIVENAHGSWPFMALILTKVCQVAKDFNLAFDLQSKEFERRPVSILKERKTERISSDILTWTPFQEIYYESYAEMALIELFRIIS